MSTEPSRVDVEVGVSVFPEPSPVDFEVGGAETVGGERWVMLRFHTLVGVFDLYLEPDKAAELSGNLGYALQKVRGNDDGR